MQLDVFGKRRNLRIDFRHALYYSSILLLDGRSHNSLPYWLLQYILKSMLCNGASITENWPMKLLACFYKTVSMWHDIVVIW